MAFRQDNKTSSTGFRKCQATGNVLSLASALVGFIWSDDRSNGGEKHVGMKSSALSNRYFIHIKKNEYTCINFFSFMYINAVWYQINKTHTIEINYVGNASKIRYLRAWY